MIKLDVGNLLITTEIILKTNNRELDIKGKRNIVVDNPV